MRKLDAKKQRRSTKSYTMLNHNGYLIFAILVIAFYLLRTFLQTLRQRAAPALS